MPTILDMRAKRKNLIEQARAILKAAEERPEGERELSDEERTNYDKAFADAGKLKDKIEREERQQAAEREIAASVDPDPPKPDPDDAGGDEPVSRRARPEYRALFGRYIRSGLPGLGPEEYRAIQADDDIKAGYLVMPEQLADGLIQAVDNLVHIRGLATKERLATAASLGIPTLDTDIADPDWTSEIATATEDTSLAVGKRNWEPKLLSKLCKISEKLLRKTGGGAERLVMDRLAYKFGTTQENAFLNGTGSGQPLGVFVDSTDGISSSRDLSTDNTTTTIEAGNLKRQKYNLNAAHRTRAQWLFHRDAISMISRMVDGNGRYLWNEGGIRTGDPDRLLNLPVMESEYAPNTFESGEYVGILGDFSYYWIVDAMDLAVQRLVELYAATNQVGFIGRMETDGMPVLETAFTRVTLA